MNRDPAPYSGRLADFISRAEPPLILLLAPLLIFPAPRVAPLLAIIPLLWLARWRARGRMTLPTPLDRPILGMLVMTGVSLWATFDLARSFPKLCGVLLGVALFYALVNGIRTDRATWLATGLLLAGGAAVAGVGFMDMRWRLVRGLPRAEGGLNPNQLGGTLTLFIPLAASLLVYVLRGRGKRLIRLGAGLGLAAVLLATGGVLWMTGSHTAWLATALALAAMVILSRERALRAGALVALLLGIGATVYYGPGRAAEAIFGFDSLEALAGHTSWTGRVEIWRRALAVIRDHPLTGIGFDTLFPIIHARYPTFRLPAGLDLAHAHNLFLQTALDLGLPGLAAFLWLLAAFGRMLWRVWRGSERAGRRALAAGLLGGLAAQLLFGLADAIALGQKPGVFTWAALGIGAAVWGQEAGGRRQEARGKRREQGRRVVAGALLILALSGWGYIKVMRAQAWLALIEADARELALLAEGRSEPTADALRDLFHTAHADMLGFQAEFALPLAIAPHLSWLPGCGGDLHAAPTLLRIGLGLTEAGEEAAQAIGGSPLSIDALENARPQLERAIATLEAARAARARIPLHRLSPRLRGWVARLDEALPLLENGARGVLILPELLGVDGARTYLILIQNDDELRPTGGFISGAARVVIRDGRIVELSFEDSAEVDDLTKPYPPAPRPMREAMGPVPWLFRDSNWSPDFPTTARAAAELYRMRHPAPIDGVAALDQQAVRLLVAALQPLELPDYPVPLTSENVIAAIRQSWAPAPGEEQGEEWRRRHKDFMGRLLTAAVHRLQDEPEQVNKIAIGRAALQALEERHLFIYLMEDGSAAAMLHRAGWDGALRSAPDSLMIVDANLGFNKVNPYITAEISYTVDLRDPARPRATLLLTHQHDGPATRALCQHGARYDATYEQMMERCYWDYVRVYVPAGSRLLEATPHPIPGDLLLTGRARSGEAETLSGGPDKAIFATFLVLAPGERSETRFVYDLPASAVERTDGGLRYRLYVQKQGGMGAPAFQIVLQLPAEPVAASPPPSRKEGNLLLYNLRLRTDFTVEVTWK